MKTRLALLAALSLAALPLVALTCTPTGTTPTNCMASFPSDAGPTAVCDINFTCDNGNFGISCVLNNANFTCTCGTDTTTTQGNGFNVNPFECTAEGAVVAANGACGWGLELAQ